MATISGETQREIVQIGQQPTLGTILAAATIPEPIEAGSWSGDNDYETILDEGRRGIDTKDFNAYQGVGKVEISWNGQVRHGSAQMPSAVHLLLFNILSAGSYTPLSIEATNVTYEHRFYMGTDRDFITVEHRVLNDAGYDKAFRDCRVTELTIKWDAGEGTLDYSVTLTGNPGILRVPTDLSGSIDDIGEPHMGWEAGVVLNDVGAWTTATGLVAGITRLISAEWSFKRGPAELLYSSENQQTFKDIFLPPLEVTATAVVGLHRDSVTAVNDTAALFAAYESKTKGLFLTSFHSGAANDGTILAKRFGLAADKFDIGDSPLKLDMGGAHAKLAITGRALYNDEVGTFTSKANTNTATAAGSTNSPIEVSLITPYVTSLNAP